MAFRIARHGRVRQAGYSLSYWWGREFYVPDLLVTTGRRKKAGNSLSNRSDPASFGDAAGGKRV